MHSRESSIKKLTDSYLKNKRTHKKPGGHTLFSHGVVMIRSNELIPHTQMIFLEPAISYTPHPDQESNVLKCKK